MGYGPEDKLSIVSLNSQRRGLQTMGGGDRPSYYQALFEKFEPGICFMPGDDKQAKLNAVVGYRQFLIPDTDGTALLYDAQKVEMKQQDTSVSSIAGGLRQFDLQEMVVPTVKVWTPAPAKTVVKEFNMVSWKFDYFQRFSEGNLTTAVESLIEFSQRLCHQTQRPILIGGEMNMIYDDLNAIVKKFNHNGKKLFLNGVEPAMSEFGYTQSMANTSLRDQRHKFMMNVIKCNPGRLNDTIKARPHYSTENVADCFIASKELKLDDASLLDIDSVIGRTVNVSVPRETPLPACGQKTPMQTYRPTYTSMDLPARPPRHHGG
ncbi:hypothetical protein ACF0H5_009092 [Mactra antiquata]